MKIKIDVDVLKKLKQDINRNIIPLVGEMLVSEYKMNITNGTDINGKSFTPNKSGLNKPLLKSGKMRNSIRVSRIVGMKIYIEVNTVYANIQNKGGIINQTITDKQRAFLWGKYKSTGNSMYKHSAMGKTLNINIPSRRFIGISARQKQLIQKIIMKNLR